MQCKLEVEQPGTTGFSRESNQIKLNQTSVKIHPAISRAPTARPHTSPGQRPGFVPGTPSALKGRPSFPIKAPSRQKTLQSCLIKANQGIRKKTTPPLGSLLLGASLELGGWNLELSRPIPFATSRLRLCVKTSVIKAHRASSRQMQKRPWLSVWPIHTLDRADWHAKGQGVYQGKILSLGRGYR